MESENLEVWGLWSSETRASEECMRVPSPELRHDWISVEPRATVESHEGMVEWCVDGDGDLEMPGPGGKGTTVTPPSGTERA